MLEGVKKKLVQFMGSLPYIKKFALLISVFSFPLIISCLFLFAEYLNRIEFTEKEIIGTQYLDALESFRRELYVLETIQRKRQLDQHNDYKIHSQLNKTEATFQAFQTVDEQYQHALGTKDLASGSQKLWSLSKEAYSSNTRKNDWHNKYARELNRKLEALFKQVGDQSNLILDPKLDTYYLMDAVLISLNAQQASLMKVQRAIHLDHMMNSLQLETQSFAQRKLRESSALIKLQKIKLNQSYLTAFNNSEKQQAKRSLNPTLQEFNRKTDQFVALISDANYNDNDEHSQLMKVMDDTILLSFELWLKTSEQLATKLDTRVLSIYKKLALFIAITLISLLISAGLIYGFYQSVIKTVLQLDTSTQSLVKGNFRDPIEVHTKDELSVIVRAFNQVMARMNAQWLKALTETEKAQAAEKIAQENERESRKLALIASRTTNGVVITDAKGVIEWVNESFEKISGYSSTELIGQKPGDLLQGPDTDPVVIKHIRQRIQDAKSVQADLVNYHKNGSRYWIHVDIQPILNDYGKVKQFMAIETDITERKNTEAALLKSERLFKSIFNSAPDCIIGIDINNKIQFANPSTEMLFGYHTRELIDQRLDILLPLTSRSNHWKHIKDFAENPQSRIQMTNRKVSARKKDGTEFPIEVSIAKVPMDDEVLFTAIVRDITRQQEYETDLKNAMLGTQGILDAASLISIISTDINGVITVFNSGAEKMLGYKSEDMVGIHTPAIIHLDEEIEARSKELSHLLGVEVQGFEAFVALARRGKSEEREWTYICKDNTQIQVTLSVTAVKNAAGNITGFLGIAKDITEAKQAREELLIESQRANKLADEARSANVAKGQFLANMSHEIRTPMNGVLGMSQLLNQTDLNDKQQEYLDAIQSSGEMLLTVLNDILDFSKIEAGKLTIESTEFELHTEILHIARMFNTLAEDKGLEVILNLPSNIPREYLGDVIRIKQVLTNLISNAVKFTSEGHILIDVSAKKTPKDNYLLTVKVEDTGIGIPASKLETLFFEFTQADSSTTRKYGGTGLGLSISKKLIELMGGELQASSEEGKGSCFWFDLELPCVKHSHENQAESLAGKRALIVDDNHLNLMIFKEELKSWNMESLSLSNPKETCSTLSHEPVDIVLLDYMMPEMDGIEVLHEIRTNYPELPVLMLSSAEVESSREILDQDPHCRFLLKPVDIQQLEHKLHELLDTGVAIDFEQTPSASLKLQKFKGKVLLVEDTLINQMLGEELLKNLGLDVDLANHGQEAVEMVSNQNYDLIFMDCLMPIMDGYQATQRIREIESSSLINTPICALTANALQDAKDQCLAAGMNDFVSKPFKQEELIEVIAKWLEPANA